MRAVSKILSSPEISRDASYGEDFCNCRRMGPIDECQGIHHLSAEHDDVIMTMTGYNGRIRALFNKGLQRSSEPQPLCSVLCPPAPTMPLFGKREHSNNGSVSTAGQHTLVNNKYGDSKHRSNRTPFSFGTWIRLHGVDIITMAIFGAIGLGVYFACTCLCSHSLG